MSRCSYCSKDFKGHAFSAREMMFGTRAVFEYGLCPNCGSCMLLTPLSSFDLPSQYPADYYAYSHGRGSGTSVKSMVVRRRGRHLFGSPNLVGRAASRVKPLKEFAIWSRYGLTADSAILDVGCGTGSFLFSLQENGFRRLQGCDPFIEKAVADRGVSIMKCGIEAVEGRFDFVFFNHSLEHVPDPGRTLRAARSLLGAGGRCVVRIPTTSSLAFERYGKDWVQLDAPRHLSIPSRAGMRLLAEAAGFSLADVIDDSSAFQFWGSEQYLKDIPLRSEGSYAPGPRRGVFGADEMAAFEEAARDANATGTGDQAAFVLQAV